MATPPPPAQPGQPGQPAYDYAGMPASPFDQMAQGQGGTQGGGFGDEEIPF